jgi:hypothetical protein
MAVLLKAGPGQGLALPAPFRLPCTGEAGKAIRFTGGHSTAPGGWCQVRIRGNGPPRPIGDTVKGGLREGYPSLERELLAKPNAAIAKAGENKEVRVSLSKLLTRKLRVP